MTGPGEYRIPIETRRSIDDMSQAIRRLRLNELRSEMHKASKKAAKYVSQNLKYKAKENDLKRTGKFIRSITHTSSSLTQPKVKIGSPDLNKAWYARIVAYRNPDRFPIKAIVERDKNEVLQIYMSDVNKVIRKFNAHSKVSRKERIDVG